MDVCNLYVAEHDCVVYYISILKHLQYEDLLLLKDP